MTMIAERPPAADPQQVRIELARTGGLAEYARAVHGLSVEPYQEAWSEAIKREDRLVIICPPDTRKSTTVQHTIEQIIGLDPESRNLWLMNTASQAEKRVIAIRKTIEENQLYQAAFAPEPDPRKWTNSELLLRRSYTDPAPTLMATGFLGAYQGLHFNRIIIDDPTDPEDVKSPTIMETQRNRLRGVLTDRLTDGGQIVAIFTRWGSSDLLPTFREMGFRVIVMPIMADYPWGKTISPSRFPVERMEQFKREKGEALFTLTYMCDTSAMEGQLIKREHLRYWDADMVPESGIGVFMAVDPAASTKTYADRSAIATVAYDFRTRRCFLLDLWQGRVEVPDLRKEIERRAKRTAGLTALGVETVAFQLSLMQDLRRLDGLPLQELPYRSRRNVQGRALGIDKDKTSRALYLDSLLTSGRLFLPRGLPLWDGVSLETELMTYGTPTNTHHDDGPDAIAFACALAEASVPPNLTVSLRAG